MEAGRVPGNLDGKACDIETLAQSHAMDRQRNTRAGYLLCYTVLNSNLYRNWRKRVDFGILRVGAHTGEALIFHSSEQRARRCYVNSPSEHGISIEG